MIAALVLKFKRCMPISATSEQSSGPSDTVASKPRAVALAGLRVLDLSRVLAGPWCTQLLADLGAEVLKVERPGHGDDTRAWGPPFAGDPQAQRSAYFLSANRNKRSLAIDFSKPEGAELIRRLAAESDVVVENFRPGALARHNLDYDSLRAIKPNLVYCSITGFGQTGPERERGGYDLVIQAMSGLMSITGEADGPPIKVGVALIDVITGLYAANGIQAALRHRDATGEGRHIDLALFDTALAALVNQASNYLASGTPPMRRGNAHPNIVPYQAFAASDGYLIVAVGNDDQFVKFCTAAGMPKLAHDPRYATNAARVEHREELIAQFEPLIAARNRDEWITRLEGAGVPCGPVNDIAEAFAFSESAERNNQFQIH
ncbi:MAG: CoA transferase, partial [Gammaproteobacteria bacterium]|nr:CoA transferase [Gammaproteobacteria bacterium]